MRTQEDTVFLTVSCSHIQVYMDIAEIVHVIRIELITFKHTHIPAHMLGGPQDPMTRTFYHDGAER